MRFSEIAAAFFSAVVMLSFCSCSTSEEVPETVKPIYEYQPPAQEEIPLPDLDYSPKQTSGYEGYYFLQKDNVLIETDKLTLAPVEMFYRDEELVCICRLYNGYDEDVSHIRLDWLTLSSASDKVIGHYYFDECEGLIIPAHQTAIRTFVFPKNSIQKIPENDDDIECEYYFSCERMKTEEQKKKEEKLRSMLSPQPDHFYYRPYLPEYEEPNTLTYVPYRIFYEKDKLKVTYRIYNGFDHTIEKIWMQWLRLYCDRKLIAENSFGLLDDLNIAPGESIDYSFEFDYDHILCYDTALINPSASMYYYYK